MKFRIITYSKERDGVTIPFLLKQIICTPPCNPEMFIEHSGELNETISGDEFKVLTRFY